MPRIPKCPKNLKHSVILIEKYDSYACLECNIWLGPRCDDENCIFCSDRPERPKEN